MYQIVKKIVSWKKMNSFYAIDDNDDNSSELNSDGENGNEEENFIETNELVKSFNQNVLYDWSNQLCMMFVHVVINVYVVIVDTIAWVWDRNVLFVEHNSSAMYLRLLKWMFFLNNRKRWYRFLNEI